MRLVESSEGRNMSVLLRPPLIDRQWAHDICRLQIRHFRLSIKRPIKILLALV